MTRDTAWAILTKHLTNPTLLKHSLATEAVMRVLATKFAGDAEEWGVTGLLHDADYDKAKGHPDQHGMLIFKLEPNTIPTTVEHAIKAHNFAYTHINPAAIMDWAILCCDDLTGIIAAVAASLPDKKLASVTPELVMTKFKQRNFAKDADKDTIMLCETKLGIPLSQFITITLTAMQSVAPQLGL